MDIRLRPAELADVPAIAEVHRRAAEHGFRHIFAASPPDPAPEWTRRVGPGRDPGWEALVACLDGADGADGAVVGVLTSGPDPLQPDACQLSRLYVEPARWGSGIGGKLFGAVLDGLPERGFRWATLWCLEENHRARRWYERMGWRLTGERKPSCERPGELTPDGVSDVRYRLEAAAGSQQGFQLPLGRFGAAIPGLGQLGDGCGRG